MGGGLGATSLGCNIMQVFFLSIFTSYSKLLLLASFSLVFSSCSTNSITVKNSFYDPLLNNYCSVTGKVIDAARNEPIWSAIITLNNNSYEVFSDFEGFFSFNNIPPGNYDIEAKFIGYKSVRLTDVNFQKNNKYLIEILLSGSDF